MKKIVLIIQVAFFASLLTACQSNEIEKQEDVVLPRKLLSSARAAQAQEGEYDVIQNGKLVGKLFVPIKETPTHYLEYWALSKDFVYLGANQNSRFDLIPVPAHFDNSQDFRIAMKTLFGTGKFVTVTNDESLLTSVQYPYE